jgi:hypothetical protein
MEPHRAQNPIKFPVRFVRIARSRRATPCRTITNLFVFIVSDTVSFDDSIREFRFRTEHKQSFFRKIQLFPSLALGKFWRALPLHMNESKAFTAATICLQIITLIESMERRARPPRGVKQTSSALVYWRSVARLCVLIAYESASDLINNKLLIEHARKL